MRKINRGPETFSPGDLHSEYSREERERISRFTDGRHSTHRKMGFQKILLFDLLFLFIIGGIIVPFIVNRNMKGRIESLAFRMELRRDESDLLISLKIRNSESLSAVDQFIYLELSPGEYESVYFEELPPPAGEERVIRYRLENIDDPLGIYYRITWKETSIRLSGKL